MALKSNKERQGGDLSLLTWSTKEKSPFVEIIRGTSVRSVVPLDLERDVAACVRSNLPAVPSGGVCYFEVRILSTGKEGQIGIGFCTQAFSMSKLPGMERGSFGLHAHDGTICHDGGPSEKYTSMISAGDIIGCGLNFFTNTSFYTRNGIFLGVAFPNILRKDSEESYHPCIGFRSFGEEIDSNFGRQSFLFDLSAYKEDLYYKATKTIESRSLGEPHAHLLTHQLVSSYLIYRGYHETAHLYAAHTNSKITEPQESTQMRLEVSQKILQGDIDSALLLIDARCPQVFDTHPHLKFHLSSLKFLSFLSSHPGDEHIDRLLFLASELEAIAALPSCATKDVKNHLQDVLGLLAYPCPLDSPFSHLFAPAAREKIANEMNRAILETFGYPSCSRLELAVRQSIHGLEVLEKAGEPLAVFLDVPRYLSE